MSKCQVVSVRMSEPDLKALQALALVHQTTLNAEIRRAIENHIEEQKLDPKFQEKINDTRQRQAALLDVLLSPKKE